MVTSLNEERLEALIVAQMTGAVRDGGGWLKGYPHDFDRAHAVDLAQLTTFLRVTRPDLVEPLPGSRDLRQPAAGGDLRACVTQTQLFKQFSDNESFKKWLANAVFNATYGKSA